ncbi:regulatory protein, luxR family [Actinokineospora alba]|uniref:Regulatory protein, luxR family n=1 Tax=Actinokineospora alba TaxID=504798 RepID=A0A1H0LZ97_9PSEU|nr:LuxR family transcriptional regulator [Actinokineospora alba]TDP67514.1 regulatory LuxR family protein [Actinokineospora alba]SDI46647.1 regulatory protein, luxR family [Actinokineospora alba]SDO73371.1 regulatory protein, luxR family [Actinokineospora alba]
MTAARLDQTRPEASISGRTVELATLVGAVAERHRLVVVEGEAGVGKTRLLRELLRDPAIAAHTVLEAHCLPVRTTHPYGAIVEMLAGAVDELRAVGPTLAPITGALAPLLPELRGLLPEHQAPLSPSVARHQVLRAVAAVLEALDRPLLVLDNLQWADEETLDLVRFLAVSPRSAVTVVTLYRGDEINTNDLLEAYRGRGHAMTQLELAPLTVPGVAEFLREYHGCADFAAELHRRSAGLPLVVEELVRELGDHPTSARLDEIGVPARVRDAVVERLTHLGRSATAVCRAVAVFGQPATEADIAALSGLSDRGMTAALEGALRARMLHETARGHYDLRHPLAARAVYEAIPGPRRREMHLRAIKRLSGSARPGLALLAHHYRHADELDRWVECVLAAAQEAADTGVPAAGMRILENALDDAELPVSAKEAVALRLSREMLQGIATPATIDRLRTVVRDWPLPRDVGAEIRMNLGLVLVNQVGQVVAGQREIERALTDLPRRRTVRARGMATLALPQVGFVPVATNLRWLAQAEQACAGTTDSEAIAALRANRITVRMQIADPGAWQVIDTLPAAPVAPSLRRQLGRTHLNMADAAVWNGHFGPARHHLDAAAELVDDRSAPYLSSLAAGTELRLLAATGPWDGLAEKADRLVAAVGQMGYLAADALLVLGWLRTWRSRSSDALRTLQSATEAAPGHVPIVVTAHAGRAAILSARGQVTGARAEAEAGLELVRQKDNWVWAAELAPVATEVFLQTGRAPEAAALLAEFRRGIQGRDAPLAAAAELVCAALLAQHRGGHTEAMALFAEAAERYRALPHRRAAARATELSGLCAAEAGDPAAAVRDLTAAEADYAALTATTDALRCRKALRRHDPRRPTRGRRGYGNALSPREKAIAKFAASGLTNREIAELLTLSRRTVECHVANIMRKLDVSSRTSLGGLLD